MGNYLCKDAEHSKQVKKSNCDNSMLPACDKDIKHDDAVTEDNPDIPFADSAAECDDVEKEKQNGELHEHTEALKLNNEIHEHELSEEKRHMDTAVDCIQQHKEKNPCLPAKHDLFECNDKNENHSNELTNEHKSITEGHVEVVNLLQEEASVHHVNIREEDLSAESTEDDIHEHHKVELAVEDAKYLEEPSIDSPKEFIIQKVEDKEESSIESSHDHLHEDLVIKEEPSVVFSENIVHEQLECEENQQVESAAQDIKINEDFIHKEVEIIEESSIQSSEDSFQEHLEIEEDHGVESAVEDPNEEESSMKFIENFIQECEVGNSSELLMENHDQNEDNVTIDHVATEEDLHEKTNLEEEPSIELEIEDSQNHFESDNDSIHVSTEVTVDSCEDVDNIGKCSPYDSDDLCVSNDAKCALEEEEEELNEIALNTVEEVIYDAKEQLRSDVESSQSETN